MVHQLILAFDVVNQVLVSYRGSATSLPQFRQGSYRTKIYLVQPDADSPPGTIQYEIADVVGVYDGLRVGFWKASTGTIGDEDTNVLALTDQLGWSYNTTDDPSYPYFEGVINTHTQEMADWIGSESSKTAFFAVNLVIGSTLYPVLDQYGGSKNATINAATDAGGGVPVSMTGGVPIVKLPVQFLDEATGELYALTRTSAGVLSFTWINP